MKASKACGDDNSVPDFVGDQVQEWLKELAQKKGGAVELELE